MRGQLFKLWDRVRSSFWFIPVVMASASVALALVSVAYDNQITSWLVLNFGWTFDGGAQGASAVMATVAGSMITIAGVVFSMTLVALSLASSQLGPRLLRSFMRDSTTQVVLGTFISTFLYCLIVLRTIRRTEDVVFIPHLSVSLGVLFAVISVGVFIYFIHHVSVSIQTNEIAARIGKDLIKGVDRLFPEQVGQKAAQTLVQPKITDFIENFEQDSRAIEACTDGYLQFIDAESLLDLAMEKDLVIRLERKPGNYVIAGCALATIWPSNKVTDQLSAQINALFVLGNQRTSDQDIKFGVNQLVEIAVRALSPGLNDPFTAITCVDHLGSALCRLAKREMPSTYLYDNKNQLRVITLDETFEEIIDAAFNQIRQYSCSCVAVSMRLLETIAVIIEFTSRSEDKTTLLRHAEMIYRGADSLVKEEGDGQLLETRLDKVKELCSS